MNASSVHLRFEIVVVARSGRCVYNIIDRMCWELCERDAKENLRVRETYRAEEATCSRSR